MRAGLLTEIIGVYELVTHTHESGELIKEYIPKYHIKANRKKLTAVVGNGINANEEFIGNTLILQTRKYSFLNENVRIKYGGNMYKVVLLNLEADRNSYLITCSKINK